MQPAQDWRKGETFLRKEVPELVPYLDKFGHCSLSPKPATTYFAILLTGIIAQQLSPAVSMELLKKVTAAVGGELTPAAILNTNPEALRACGLVPQKVEYARNFAGLVHTGAIEMDSFAEQTEAQILKQLLTVKGLGKWTIEMFLLLSLCRADVLPGDDYLLQKECQILFKLETLPKRGQIIKLTEGWRPWRGLAAWYLWQHAAKAR